MKIENFDLNEQIMIVAELSANHGHSIDIARDTIKAAKEAGADAIKLQTYTADTITINSDKKYFRLNSGTLWDGRTLYDLYEEAYTPWGWHQELQEYAMSLGLIFFSSPFDYSAVDFLADLNVPAFKIASFELLDLPLVEYAARKHKPMIMSTGIASLAEIEEAVNMCRKVGNNDIILLKCTSSYPAPVDQANLLTIANMKETFDVEAGLSDHSIGRTVATVAVPMGARLIEKHFILDKSIGGPDSEFSMEPDDFAMMVHSIRDAEKAIGRVSYELDRSKTNNRITARSLFIVEDIRAGEKFTEKNVRSIRPGYGLAPKYINDILGCTAKIDLEKGEPLSWAHVNK